MKKIVFILIILALAAPVFAQVNNDRDTKLYVINIPVEKIYPSHEGYIIMYKSGASTTGTIGIPNEWFTDAGGRAQLVKLPLASDWPTMSVFFVDGEFSHVRLYTHPAKSHWTWGSVPMGTDVSRFFEDSDSFKLKF